MKDKITALVITFSLASTTGFGQVSSAVLNINNTKVEVRSDGLLFFDGEGGQFIAPYKEGQSEISTMKSAGIWLAGKEAGTDNLHGAIQLYNENGESDFAPGSLIPATGEPSGHLTKIFRVTKTEIEEQLADLADNGLIDNPNPNVFGWPGDNNPYFSECNGGEELPDALFGYKNFFDLNDDGIYDPYSGDHPSVVIRGCEGNPVIPDELLWFVFHDNLNHTQSNMNPIRMEIECMVYAFNCQESPLGNSIFVRYRLNNLSLFPLDSIYFGAFSDFDIGNPADDFFGVDAPRSLVFGYNGDEVDEGGYDSNAPVMALDLLRGPLDSSINELAVANVMPVEETPLTSPEEYYNILSGNFVDGTPAPNNGIFYTGNPNNPGEWSEVSAGNVPGNRKVVASFGPFYMNQGAVNELVLGYTFYQKPENTPLQNVEVMYEEADIVQGLFNNCFDISFTQNCTQDPTSLIEQQELIPTILFPNPAYDLLHVELQEAKIEMLTISTLDGKLVLTEKLPALETKVSIDLTSLDSGFYVFEGWKGSRKIVRSKFFVVKK